MEIMRKESFQLILERHQQSGLSVTDFCQNEGYNRSSFYQWMKKFGLSTKYVRNKYSTVMAADADFAPVRFSSNNKTDRTINTPGEIMISFPGDVKVHFRGVLQTESALKLITQIYSNVLSK